MPRPTRSWTGEVGLSESELVLGKHSGRHALRARLQDLGFELSDAELDLAFRRFKAFPSILPFRQTISSGYPDAPSVAAITELTFRWTNPVS